ncbi:unnamed protein product [Lepeophtheirus salmonis]|uniref:(salmon louse) hypothetical protein n=1 Tax=Lepeophtheirus salmonis TaxID=72036 RepID=A0A7R8CBH5_LEPSM|nr:unnamed protein product [Lepeophtheirus salmonis]CAF2759158.1 unnamed protein product [Lepeophtheirus salmonis]
MHFYTMNTMSYSLEDIGGKVINLSSSITWRQLVFRSERLEVSRKNVSVRPLEALDPAEERSSAVKRNDSVHALGVNHGTKMILCYPNHIFRRSSTNLIGADQFNVFFNKTADETTTKTQVCSGNGSRVHPCNECREVCLKRKGNRTREKSNEGDSNHGKSNDICMENDKEDVSVENPDISGSSDIQGRPRDNKKLEDLKP